MSGLGGGGYMVVYSARDDRSQVVDFGMVAPAALDVTGHRAHRFQSALLPAALCRRAADHFGAHRARGVRDDAAFPRL